MKKELQGVFPQLDSVALINAFSPPKDITDKGKLIGIRITDMEGVEGSREVYFPSVDYDGFMVTLERKGFDDYLISKLRTGPIEGEEPPNDDDEEAEYTEKELQFLKMRELVYKSNYTQSEIAEGKRKENIETVRKNLKIILKGFCFEENLFSTLPENVVLTPFLEQAFPFAKHAVLQHKIKSKGFMKQINKEFLQQLRAVRKEGFYNEIENKDVFAKNMYYTIINRTVYGLYNYSDERRKKDHDAREQQEKERLQKNGERSCSVEEKTSPVQVEVKELTPQQYKETVINQFCEFVTTPGAKKELEKYISRVLDAAYKNQKEAPIEQISERIQQATKGVIGPQVIENLQEEALEFGFVAPEEPALNDPVPKEIIPTPVVAPVEVQAEPIDEAEVIAETIMEIFRDQGFDFKNEKAFWKQFDSLLEKTALGDKKKKKLGQLIVQDLRTVWETYPNDHYVMKLDAGSEAHRIVRKEKEICDFLNHDDYTNKYVKKGFAV